MTNYPLPKGGTISHPHLVFSLAKPGSAILASLDANKTEAWHMASCIPGEVAELFDCLGLFGMNGDKPLDRDNLIEELGDIEFYIEGLRAATSIPRDETVSETLPLLREWNQLLALPGRAGDVFDAAKRWVIYNKPFDRQPLVDALRELEMLLALVRSEFGVTREEALAGNVWKLGIRYEGGYSDAAANARADKQGTVH